MVHKPEADQGKFAVDPQVFAELFFDLPKNRNEIWKQMAEIVRHAARGIRARRASDMEEFKGDALSHAMECVGEYDVNRRTAYFYFYEIISNHMKARAGAPRQVHLGEHDVDLAFNDTSSLSAHDATAAARRNCKNHWRSFRLSGIRDRHLAEKYFRVCIRRALKQLRETDCRGEKAAIAFVIETLKNSRRDLLG